MEDKCTEQKSVVEKGKHSTLQVGVQQRWISMLCLHVASSSFELLKDHVNLNS